MSRTWKPGDVAWIRVGTGDWEIGLFQDDQTWACAHTRPRKEHEDVRVGGPLVVIDAEDREQVERLGTVLMEAGVWRVIPRDVTNLSEHRDDQIQAALRSLITPPRPKEPTGLGAVVEDASGDFYVYTGLRDDDDQRWWVHGVNRRKYAAVTAVRVLSEGVTA